MKIMYTRRGGRMPPPDRELLTIEPDGSFTMWRSVNTPACGRFAGRLSVETWNVLQRDGVAAVQAGVLNRPILPDSAIETIQIEETWAKLGHTDTPDGAWGQMAIHLRQLLTSLCQEAEAAVSLHISPQATRAKLVHQGQRPLSLDFSRLSVRAILWGGYYEQQGNWSWSAPASLGHVEATPGWEFELNFQHGFAPTADQVVHTYVTFSVYDREGLVNVSLVDAPLLP